MKHLLPRLIIPLLALVLLPAARALEFRFLAWDEKVAAQPVAVLGGESKDGVPIKDLHPLKRSPGVDATLSGGNLLLRALDRKDAAGKPVDFSVKVAGDMTRPLVLLLPDPKAASGLRGFALEDAVANFPWGTFRLLNGTGKELAVALGSLHQAMPAGWQPLDFRPGGDKPLPVEIATTEVPKKPLYAAFWQPDPDVRRLVFVVPGTEVRLGPLAIKVIPEDRRSLEEETAAAANGAGSGAGARTARNRSGEEP